MEKYLLSFQVYADARKKSNINIHVINKNRLNGKLKILH
jgi:hypothetical protein